MNKEVMKQEQDEPESGFFSREAMAEHSDGHVHLKQEQDELLANDPLPRACNLAGVDYQTFLKIKAYMPLYTTPQRRTWIGLLDDEKEHIEISGGKADLTLAEKIEAILKERNT